MHYRDYSKCTEICIGIEAEHNELDPVYNDGSFYFHYAYSNKPAIFSHKQKNDIHHMIELDVLKYEYSKDDIITMVVDTRQNTIDLLNVEPHTYRYWLHFCRVTYTL